LADIQDYEEMLARYNQGTRLILEPQAGEGFKNLQLQSEVSLLIGPEGGFSDEEVQQAISTGFQVVKFGPRILRTETAAISAIAVIQTLWGDIG
jgi:16S rRNA (uracil1498-N3)-methyltransferase